MTTPQDDLAFGDIALAETLLARDGVLPVASDWDLPPMPLTDQERDVLGAALELYIVACTDPEDAAIAQRLLNRSEDL